MALWSAIQLGDLSRTVQHGLYQNKNHYNMQPTTPTQRMEPFEEGVDPEDEFQSAEPRRKARLFAYDWAKGFVSPYRPADVPNSVLKDFFLKKTPPLF